MSILSGALETPVTVRHKQWVWHLSALAIAIAAVLVMFQYEVANAVEAWWFYPAYSHCFLVIPICLWLVWRKRAELGGMTPELGPKALFLIPPLVLTWLAGYFALINEVRQFAMVGMIVVAILTLIGPKVFRVVAFPVLYLFFLVPFGQYFIPPMQTFTTWFTDWNLNLLQVPHFTEGTVIELPNGRFEIADACAGLRFLTATIALGVLFVQLTYNKWRKAATFLIACLAVPLIANGYRCVFTMALAYWTNDFETVAANHITAGFVFNVIILLIMFWIGTVVRDDDQPNTKRHAQTETRAVQRTGLSATTAAVLLMIATGPAVALWQENRSVATNASTLMFPPLDASWVVLPPNESWNPIYAAADQHLDTRIAPRQSGASSAVDIKVLYYGRIRKQTSLISTANR